MNINRVYIISYLMLAFCAGCVSDLPSSHQVMAIQPPSNGPVPDFDISEIVKQSDAIVVGRMESTDKRKDVNGNQVDSQGQFGVIRIEAVYKGDVKVTQEVSVRYSPTQNTLDKITPTKTKLYFLKSDQKGNTIFTDNYYLSFPVLGNRPKIEKNSTPFEAVKAEILQNIEFGSEDMVITSLDVLRDAPETFSLAKNKLAKSRSLVIRASAAAYRASKQDVDAFDEAVSVIEEAEEAKDRNPDESNRIVGIASSTFMHLVDKISAKQTKRLLAFQEPNIDFAVGSVINEVAVGDTDRAGDRAEFAPVAITLLLRSSDKDVQYNSIQLLSVLRGRGPSKDDFLKDSQTYVAEFTTWWNKQNKK